LGAVAHATDKTLINNFIHRHISWDLNTTCYDNSFRFRDRDPLAVCTNTQTIKSSWRIMLPHPPHRTSQAW